MSPKNKNTGNSTIDAVIAIILFCMLAFGSLQLKTKGVVGEASLLVLLIASLVSGFMSGLWVNKEGVRSSAPQTTSASRSLERLASLDRLLGLSRLASLRRPCSCQSFSLKARRELAGVREVP